MPLWVAAEPLVLASASEARRDVLLAAGIPLEIMPAALDERGLAQRRPQGAPAEIAKMLACAKAQAVGAQKPGRLVLGGDQTLALEGRRFSKPADRDAAREQLRALRGKTHQLHSAVVLARDGASLFEYCEEAALTMRDFSDGFLESYLDAIGADAVRSVGGYQLERLGIHLFERIAGDHFTILGLPLLALLRFFRQEGWLAG